MKNGKPFIKWVGGKTQLIYEIEKKLPKDFSKKEITYIEPFVGGGAILFYFLQKYPNIKKAVINDINPHLIVTYKIIKNNPNELIKKLLEIEYEYKNLMTDKSQKLYYLSKREFFNTGKLTDIEVASTFIFLNRTCFNGLYRVNSKGLFNVPFGKYENPKICNKDTILADSELLQKVEILQGDFEQTLDYAKKNTLFYFDPPYKPLNRTSSFNSYSVENFDDNEQIRLGKFCKRINSLGHSFILSNSDVKGKNPLDDFFDNLYSRFEIQRVSAMRMVNANAQKRGKLTELLISNNRLGV